MAKFKFGITNDQNVVTFTALLGAAGATDQLPNPVVSQNDIGKPFKMTAGSRYGICADGDLIEGFLIAVDGATIDGLGLGTIKSNGRQVVTVSGTTLVVGDYVVSAANAAKGTKPTANGLVKKAATPADATAALAASRFGWRVVELIGSGAAGTDVLIERVNA